MACVSPDCLPDSKTSRSSASLLGPSRRKKPPTRTPALEAKGDPISWPQTSSAAPTPPPPLAAAARSEGVDTAAAALPTAARRISGTKHALEVGRDGPRKHPSKRPGGNDGVGGCGGDVGDDGGSGGGDAALKPIAVMCSPPAPEQVAAKKMRGADRPGVKCSGGGGSGGCEQGSLAGDFGGGGGDGDGDEQRQVAPVYGVFHPDRYISRRECIEHKGTFITRSRFEKLGGSLMAKWYRSIRVVETGEALGTWLVRRGLPVLKGNPRNRRPAAAGELGADADNDYAEADEGGGGAKGAVLAAAATTEGLGRKDRAMPGATAEVAAAAAAAAAGTAIKARSASGGGDAAAAAAVVASKAAAPIASRLEGESGPSFKVLSGTTAGDGAAASVRSGVEASGAPHRPPPGDTCERPQPSLERKGSSWGNGFGPGVIYANCDWAPGNLGEHASEAKMHNAVQQLAPQRRSSPNNSSSRVSSAEPPQASGVSYGTVPAAAAATAVAVGGGTASAGLDGPSQASPAAAAAAPPPPLSSRFTAPPTAHGTFPPDPFDPYASATGMKDDGGGGSTRLLAAAAATLPPSAAMTAGVATGPAAAGVQGPWGDSERVNARPFCGGKFPLLPPPPPPERHASAVDSDAAWPHLAPSGYGDRQEVGGPSTAATVAARGAHSSDFGGTLPPLAARRVGADPDTAATGPLQLRRSFPDDLDVQLPYSFSGAANAAGRARALDQAASGPLGGCGGDAAAVLADPTSLSSDGGLLSDAGPAASVLPPPLQQQLSYNQGAADVPWPPTVPSALSGPSGAFSSRDGTADCGGGGSRSFSWQRQPHQLDPAAATAAAAATTHGSAGHRLLGFPGEQQKPPINRIDRIKQELWRGAFVGGGDGSGGVNCDGSFAFAETCGLTQHHPLDLCQRTRQPPQSQSQPTEVRSRPLELLLRPLQPPRPFLHLPPPPSPPSQQQRSSGVSLDSFEARAERFMRGGAGGGASAAAQPQPQGWAWDRLEPVLGRTLVQGLGPRGATTLGVGSVAELLASGLSSGFGGFGARSAEARSWMGR